MPIAAARQPAAQKDAYVALLERYAREEADGAAREALDWDFKSARRIARELSEGQSGTAPAHLRRQKLIVLVHTEAGLRTAAPQQQLLIANDAVERLWKASGDHNHRGVRLFIRDWYLLVVSQFATLGQLQSLRSHIDAGLARFKDDPELLLARGTLHEQMAESTVVDRSLLTRIYTPSLAARWRLDLYDARDDYARAGRGAGAPAEARLRWGRVEGILGNAKSARAALAEVAGSDAPPYLRYLGHLFRAELLEQADDAAGARTAYESALQLWPGANAPKLALSRLAAAAGDLVLARQWLARSFAEASPERTDPWWDYLHGQSWRGDDRLASFRRRGLEP